MFFVVVTCIALYFVSTLFSCCTTLYIPAVRSFTIFFVAIIPNLKHLQANLDAITAAISASMYQMSIVNAITRPTYNKNRKKTFQKVPSNSKSTRMPARLQV